MSLDKEEKQLEDISKDPIERIEHVEALDYVKDQFDLSSIEATAVSKTAWLISIVVSTDNILFGTLTMQP